MATLASVRMCMVSVTTILIPSSGHSLKIRLNFIVSNVFSFCCIVTVVYLMLVVRIVLCSSVILCIFVLYNVH